MLDIFIHLSYEMHIMNRLHTLATASLTYTHTHIQANWNIFKRYTQRDSLLEAYTHTHSQTHRQTHRYIFCHVCIYVCNASAYFSLCIFFVLFSFLFPSFDLVFHWMSQNETLIRIHYAHKMKRNKRKTQRHSHTFAVIHSYIYIYNNDDNNNMIIQYEIIT